MMATMQEELEKTMGLLDMERKTTATQRQSFQCGSDMQGPGHSTTFNRPDGSHGKW